MVYVVLGGAHADILTDGVQGFLMVVIGAALVFMFLIGYGVEGGLMGMVENLRRQDPNLVGWLNEESVLYRSWWSVLAIIISHLPLACCRISATSSGRCRTPASGGASLPWPSPSASLWECWGWAACWLGPSWAMPSRSRA